MGARIEALASAFGADRERSSLRLAIEACRRCLTAAGRAASETELLIYSGTYHDGFVIEPAQASLVQRELGASPTLSDAGSSTLAFDIGSPMAAIEVAASGVDSGQVRRALVVASDTAAVRGNGAGVHCIAAAAALLLGPGSSRSPAFARFHSATFPEDGPLLRSGLIWTRPDGGGPGVHRLRIEEAPDYAKTCARRSEQVLRELLAEAPPSPDRSLLICSQLPPDLAEALATRLGVPAAILSAPRPRLHSAGVLCALEAAVRGQRDLDASDLLWVGVEPGLVIRTALYRKPPGPTAALCARR